MAFKNCFSASTDEIWIGLNDRKSEGFFEWADHSTVSFTSWESGRPDVSTERNDCILIRGEVTHPAFTQARQSYVHVIQVKCLLNLSSSVFIWRMFNLHFKWTTPRDQSHSLIIGKTSYFWYLEKCNCVIFWFFAEWEVGGPYVQWEKRFHLYEDECLNTYRRGSVTGYRLQNCMLPLPICIFTAVQKFGSSFDFEIESPIRLFTDLHHFVTFRYALA